MSLKEEEAVNKLNEIENIISEIDRRDPKTREFKSWLRHNLKTLVRLAYNYGKSHGEVDPFYRDKGVMAIIREKCIKTFGFVP